MQSGSPAPEERFSNRVENYVRYRPSYPAGVISLLQEHANLTHESVVADIGSGTGISSRLLLEQGFQVMGVEPNREMRLAAEELLCSYPRFRSIAGSSDATTLPNASVDLIIAAQAFHWFQPESTRREWTRVLKPTGHVALIWNVRRVDSTPFLRAYENLLLEYATDYSAIRHENIGEDQLRSFFREGRYRKFSLPNEQSFDLQGLEGRLLSSSYAPAPGQPRHEAMMAALREMFAAHQTNGEVRFEYDTEIFLGS